MSDESKPQDIASFKIQDIVGCLACILLDDMAGIYQVCSHLAGYPVMTHEIPSIADEVNRAIAEQLPQLKPLIEEIEPLDLTKSPVRLKFIQSIKDRFGEELVLKGNCIDTTDSHRLLAGKTVIPVIIN